MTNETPNPSISPRRVLFWCIGFIFMGYIISSISTFVVVRAFGLDPFTFIHDLSEKSPIGTRNMLRIMQVLSQIFLFALPALLTAWVVYKKKWLRYFQLQALPDVYMIGWSVLWLIVSIYFVQLSYLVNKLLPLPQSIIDIEKETLKAMEALLATDFAYEIVVNFIIIGVIAALVEELLFRGIVQQQLGRIFKSDHTQVWLAAFIFSAIHMQFQGFFPRMILGALLGYLFIWTRNLWIPIILHFLNNGIQVIIKYAFNIKTSEMDDLGNLETIWLVVAGLISMVVTIYIGQLIRSKYYIEASETTLKQE